MPRVHVPNADQRRRPHRAGIFSLTTPFQRTRSSTSPPRYHGVSNRRSPDIEDFAEDDMEFRGTRTQAEMTMPAARPPARAASSSAASSNGNGNGNGTAEVVAAAGNAGRSDPSLLLNVHNNGSGSNGSSRDAAAAFVATGDGRDGATPGLSGRQGGYSDSDQPSKPMAGQRQQHQKLSSGESSHRRNEATRLHQQDEQQFEDGMEDPDSDSDATTLDGSEDLLADTGNDNDENSEEANQQRRRASRAAMMMSPVSPATRTLDRLSKFGSQEGGAELCIHLLAAAAETHGKAGSKKKSDEERKEKDGPAVGMEEEKKGSHEPDAINIQQSGSKKAVQFSVIDNDPAEDTNDEDTIKQQRIRELKQYFMSTKNSSPYAFRKKQSHLAPSAPFCNKCKRDNNTNTNPTLTHLSQSSAVSSLPHHGLCPYHLDFYNSGSYEILNLVVDGNLLGCEACVHHFQHGRMNKKLVHGMGCKRGVKKGGRKAGAVCGKKDDDEKKKKVNISSHAQEKSTSISSIDNKKAAKQTKNVRQSSPTPNRRRNAGTISTRPNTTSSPLPNQRRIVRTSSTRPNTSPMPRMNAGSSTRPSTRSVSPTQRSDSRNHQNNSSQRHQSKKNQGPFQVGTLVFIEDRQWPGMNDPGGVARITKVHPTEDGKDDEANPERLYDARYVIARGKPKQVEEEYISFHKDYISPSKDQYLSVANVEECGGGGVEIAKAKDAAGAEAGTSDEGEPPMVDESGHPLSEYECLRLRNIRRNEARLKQLGLLPPQRQAAKSNSNDNSEGGVQLNREPSSSVSRQGRARTKRPPQEVEKRTLPKRRKSKKSDEDDDGKPKTVSSSAAAGYSMGKEETKRAGTPSLAVAAKSGCKKCIAELKTGKKTSRSHDLICPRKGIFGRSVRDLLGPGYEKKQQEKLGANNAERSQQQPKMMLEKEKENHNNTNEQAQRSAQPVVKLAANSKDKGAFLGKHVQHSKQPDVKLPPSNREGQVQPSLMDAAKAGCRKCTLEWQTDDSDLTIDHDICCPRARKREPLSTEKSQLKARLGSEPKKMSKKVCNSISSISPMPSSNSLEVERRTKASKVTPVRVHRPIPSPAPTQLKKKAKILSQKQQRGPPPPLPTWIQEFISESDQHNKTVPAPRGSKWLQCPNPWGKMGHVELDFVIISPFQSESASDLLSIFHQAHNGRGTPKRFVANPFEEGSPYHATHRSPANSGYSVLRLTRDRMGLRPWGFTVRLHEFGCACLVDGIEPLSPAEAAEDISGWSDTTSSSDLKLHDMVICVNGKSVGSMTMPELQIELDVCGPELMLVVSKFDTHVGDSSGGDVTLEDLAMDWNDIGAGCESLNRKRVSFEDEFNGHNKELSELKVQYDVQDANSEDTELEETSGRVDEASQAGPKISIMESQPELLVNCKKFDASKKKTHKQSHVLVQKQQASAVKVVVHKSGHNETVKSNQGHGSTCPTKDASRGKKKNTQAYLSEAAQTGCKKCIHELRELEPIRYHDLTCPRKFKSKNPSQASKNENSNDETEHPERRKCALKRSHSNIAICRPVAQIETAKAAPKASKTTHKKKCASNKTISRYQKQLDELSDEEYGIVPKKGSSKKSKSNDQLEDDCDSADASFSGSDTEEEAENESGDENPWLGCVCGKTHPHPIKVFWIQCEGCDAWYNVAQECVGFGASEAEGLDEWCCWACKPPVAGLGL